VDEQGSAALLTRELDDSMGGKPVQIRVTQGKEPPHFCQLFKGNMVVHSGGNASGFKNSTETDSSNITGISLFHIKGTSPLNTYGVEVKALSSSLNSEDAFVLVTPSVIYTWLGSGANADEVSVSRNIANVLRSGASASADIVTLTEGSEPEEFWTYLGGKTEYPRISVGVSSPRPPRLFSASTAAGFFKLEEVS
jgi:Gelsolin repeat